MTATTDQIESFIADWAVTGRFEFKFAVAAIIATMHDVILVAGWFAFTGHEFDLAVLAGVLFEHVSIATAYRATRC